MKATGQPVVIDNRPGASTMIAAQATVAAPADEYTLIETEKHLFHQFTRLSESALQIGRLHAGHALLKWNCATRSMGLTEHFYRSLDRIFEIKTPWPATSLDHRRASCDFPSVVVGRE